MFPNIVSDIRSYIEYLQNTHFLHVTLHPMEYEALIQDTELFLFNIHANPYCLYLKQNPAIAHHCLNCQNKVFERCKLGEYSGVCHAGVFEYIYPFRNGDSIIGFISVSGYQAEAQRAISSVNRISRKYELPLEELKKEYETNLIKNHPDKARIDTLIRPLCYMLELAYRLLPPAQHTADKTQNLYGRILYYLNQNHCSKISLDDISRELYCSKSHISHLFKSRRGQSICDYLNTIRINDAKMLLLNSNLNVTQIALSVGYSDSNYFAIVFRRLENMSPLQYRKSNQNKDGSAQIKPAQTAFPVSCAD